MVRTLKRRNGRTDGQTDPFIETRSRMYKGLRVDHRSSKPYVARSSHSYRQQRDRGLSAIALKPKALSTKSHTEDISNKCTQHRHIT